MAGTATIGRRVQGGARGTGASFWRSSDAHQDTRLHRYDLALSGEEGLHKWVDEGAADLHSIAVVVDAVAAELRWILTAWFEQKRGLPTRQARRVADRILSPMVGAADAVDEAGKRLHVSVRRLSQEKARQRKQPSGRTHSFKMDG